MNIKRAALFGIGLAAGLEFLAGLSAADRPAAPNRPNSPAAFRKWAFSPEGDGSVQPTFAATHAGIAEAPLFGRLAVRFDGTATPPSDDSASPFSGGYIYRPSGPHLSTNRVIQGETEFPPQRLGQIEVSRRVGISADGRSCRWLNILRNVSPEPVAFQVVISHRGPPGGTGGTIVGCGDGHANPGLGAAWSIGRLDSGALRGRYLANVVEGRVTRAPLAGLDFGFRDFGGPDGRLAERPYWTYAVSLKPGQTGILLTALSVGDSLQAVEAELAERPWLREGPTSGADEAPGGTLLNFPADPVEITFVSPKSLESFTDLVPIQIHFSQPISHLDVYARCVQIRKDCPNHPFDPTYHETGIFSGAWSGTDWTGNLSVSEMSASEDGSFWIAARADGAWKSVTVLDARADRNLVRMVSPGEGSVVEAEFAVSGSFFSHVFPGRARLFLDGSLLAEKAFRDPRCDYSGGTLTDQLDAARMSEGWHTAAISIEDESGRTLKSRTAAFSVARPRPPRTPPAVFLSSPAARSVLGGVVRVALRGEDEIAMAGLTLLVDGVPVREWTGSSAVLEGGHDWNTWDFAEGRHTLTAVARNDAGLTAQKSIPLRVRNEFKNPGPGKDKGRTIR